MNPSNHPAGWYPDPSGKPGQMYWDGQRWRAGIPGTPAPAAAPWDQVRPYVDRARPQLDKGRHFWSGLSGSGKIILGLGGLLVVAAVIAVPVAVFGGSGGGGSSGTPAQSDSYQHGYQFVSGFKSAEFADAKTTCGMLGVAERAGLSDDEKNDWNRGCEDSLRAQGAS